jgi:hypothetical protein
VINLTQYFGLSGSAFLSAGGNFAPISVGDRSRIAAFTGALDREATVIKPPARPTPADAILFTIDVGSKPVNFSYSAEWGVVSFGAGGQSYAVAAPPSFRELWAELICSR